MDDLISRQSAINALLHNQEVYSNNFGDDAIDKYTVAIIDNDAQTIAQLPSAQQWIPVTERLPEEKINENTSDFEYVLCTTTFGDVRPYKFGQTIGWSEPHFWHWNSMMDKYVVAWCELPEPWKGETDGLGR